MAKRATQKRSRSGKAVTSGPDNRFDVVKDHAFSMLSGRDRMATNLYVDRRIYKRGELIGPRRQEIVATKPSILVFADDDPMANFAHQCRYLLYSAESHELDRVVPASFSTFVRAP